jgi:hypothetical protein
MVGAVENMKAKLADVSTTPPSNTPKGRAQEKLDREAAAEADAGIGIPHEDIERWVASWGTEHVLPMPVARKVK